MAPRSQDQLSLSRLSSATVSEHRSPQRKPAPHGGTQPHAPPRRSGSLSSSSSGSARHEVLIVSPARTMAIVPLQPSGAAPSRARDATRADARRRWPCELNNVLL